MTDNLGAVVFDVRDVGATVDLGPDGVRYRFEGSVTVSNSDGYRICTLTKIRVDSGTAMALPCCKIGDPSIPYFEYLSFNGWDMQYCECEVLRTGAAYNPIPITGKLHLAGTQTAEVSLWTRTTDGTQTLDGKALFTVNVDVKNGVGTFRRSDLFLKLEPPSDALLPKDRSFEVHVKAGGTPYVFPVKLVVHDSPIPFKTGNANVVPEVSFGQAGSSANIFTLPSSFPAVLRGSSLTCWVPTFPLQFYLNPLGYFFLGGRICISKEGQGIEGFKQEGLCERKHARASTSSSASLRSAGTASTTHTQYEKGDQPRHHEQIRPSVLQQKSAYRSRSKPTSRRNATSSRIRTAKSSLASWRPSSTRTRSRTCASSSPSGRSPSSSRSTSHSIRGCCPSTPPASPRRETPSRSASSPRQPARGS